MAKKNKKIKKVSSSYSPMDHLAEKRAERNAFIRNQPLLYIIIALIAFFGGNYLFDLFAKIF